MEYTVPGFLGDNFDFNGTIPTIPEISTDYRITLYILGALHLILAVWMVLEYFIVHLPHFVLPELPRDELGTPLIFPNYIERLEKIKGKLKKKYKERLEQYEKFKKKM